MGHMWQALLKQAVRMTKRVTNHKTLFLNSKGAEKNIMASSEYNNCKYLIKIV